MKKITIATFNANNLFVRYKFGNTFPGDLSKKSIVKSQSTSGIGYLPINVNSSFEIWNDTQRRISAKTITNNDTTFPDILFLQEIESLIALRLFNENFLGNHYKNALVIDSRDFRQIDVGVLSNIDIQNIKTHVDDRDSLDENSFLFSRDCLELEFKISKNSKRPFTVFLNHLKSKFIDPEVANAEAQELKDDAKRERQAAKIVDIINKKFPGNLKKTELFAVIGDFNDVPGSNALAPLFKSKLLYDPIQRLPEAERWTYYWKGHSVSQIDNILISPRLHQLTSGILPHIERRGISFQRVLADGKPGPKQISLKNTDDVTQDLKVDFQFERFAGVDTVNYASDHCPVFFDIPTILFK